MTTQDARERATQTVANARAIYQRIASEGAPGYWSGSMIGEWEERRAIRRDAAWADLEAAMKREYEQRIAALVALARELFEGAESVDASYMALYVSPDLWGRWLAAIGLQECPTCHGCGGCGEHETDALFGADPCPTCEGSGVRALRWVETHQLLGYLDESAVAERRARTG